MPRESSFSSQNTQLRYIQVVDEVRNTALRVGREPSQIRILAVSKQKTEVDIRDLVERGFRDFGENYVAEALPKMDALASAKCKWHFIGVVQSNKTRAIAQHFDWVQSIDRTRIGTRLSKARDECSDEPLNVCVQVNIDDEATKSGVSEEELPDLVEQLQQLPRLTVRGLMAIPNPKADRDATRFSFHRMFELFERLRPQTSLEWDTLSMGMSADYAMAIEEGATMIRLGTALFGPRV